MKLSIVIPAYNEARRIMPSCERIFAYMNQHHPIFEVVLVDDGSTDGAMEMVQERFGDRPQLRILSYGGNRGKGYAVRFGSLRADGDIVLFSDTDLSTPIEEMEKMLALAAQGYDLVIGNRAHALSDIRQRQPLFRDWSGKLFNTMVRVLVSAKFRDTQCGFKLFRRDAMLPVLRRLRIDGFAFDVEMIAMAEAAGLRVVDVPVVWINSPESMVRFWPALRAFVDLVQIRKRIQRPFAEIEAVADA
jgi:dolichyl-phosphate beta-glucosyltransferase